jgi:hypothetical protein
MGNQETAASELAFHGEKAMGSQVCSLTPKKGLPSFWSSAIAKVLVGENPCLLQPWLQSRFDGPKTVNSNMAGWKADHSAKLQFVAEQYRRNGWKVDVERFFRVTGQFAILSGKADIICQKHDERPLIIDVKTGQPRDSDVAQVALEMLMIPMAWKTDMTFSGLVVYGDQGVDVTARQAAELKPKLFKLLRDLGTMERPVPAPGKDSCRFCDIPDADCGVRWKDEQTEAATVEF